MSAYIHVYNCVYICVFTYMIYAGIYVYVCVHTCIYMTSTLRRHSDVSYHNLFTAGFEDLLRKFMCYILYRLHTIVFWVYPGPQSLILLLSLRIVTRVHVSHRIKGREKWPELFFTAGLRSSKKVLSSTAVSF